MREEKFAGGLPVWGVGQEKHLIWAGQGAASFLQGPRSWDYPS